MSVRFLLSKEEQKEVMEFLEYLELSEIIIELEKEWAVLEEIKQLAGA